MYILKSYNVIIQVCMQLASFKKQKNISQTFYVRGFSHAEEIPKYLLHKLLDIFVSHCSLKQQDSWKMQTTSCQVHMQLLRLYIQKSEKPAELEICRANWKTRIRLVTFRISLVYFERGKHKERGGKDQKSTVKRNCKNYYA